MSKFHKYQTQGAYHWRELNPLNFRLYNPRLLARYQAIVQAVQKRLTLSRARGLDVGCGDGALYERFRRLGATMVGIDYDSTGLRAALDIMTGPLLAAASANALPFPSDIFDFAVMSELIEHLHVPQPCLEETARVLKPRGVLVVTTPHRNPSGRLHSTEHVQEFDGQELEKLLKPRFQNVAVLGLHPLPLSRRYVSRSAGARPLRWLVRVSTLMGFNPFARCGPLNGRPAWDHLIAVGEAR